MLISFQPLRMAMNTSSLQSGGLAWASVFQIPSSMFNWIQVRAISRPICGDNISISKEIPYTFCPMAGNVIVLEHDIFISKGIANVWDQEMI